MNVDRLPSSRHLNIGFNSAAKSYQGGIQFVLARHGNAVNSENDVTLAEPQKPHQPAPAGRVDPNADLTLIVSIHDCPDLPGQFPSRSYRSAWIGTKLCLIFSATIYGRPYDLSGANWVLQKYDPAPFSGPARRLGAHGLGGGTAARALVPSGVSQVLDRKIVKKGVGIGGDGESDRRASLGGNDKDVWMRVTPQDPKTRSTPATAGRQREMES